MTLGRALHKLYPAANPCDFGTTPDGKISNWNAAKLGPKPKEADVMTQAQAMQPTQRELRLIEAKKYIKDNWATLTTAEQALARIIQAD